MSSSPTDGKAPPLPAQVSLRTPLSHKITHSASPGTAKSQLLDSCTSLQGGHLPFPPRNAKPGVMEASPIPTLIHFGDSGSLLACHGLCITHPHHWRLLALAACLIAGTSSDTALQGFEVSSDIINLSNLSLLFSCLHCWAKSVINEFVTGEKEEKRSKCSAQTQGPGQDNEEQKVQVSHVGNNTMVCVHGKDLLLKT